MMNSTICVRTDSLAVGTPDLYSDTPCVPSMTANSYATVPMAVVRPVTPSLDEEEFHSSFEFALRERSNTLDVGFHDLDGLPISEQRLTCKHGQMYYAQPMARLLVCMSVWQRYVVYLGLVLSLLLVGFDIMGLLVLHTR